MAAKIERLWRRLQPLATKKMPLDVLSPRTSRFGSPLVLSTICIGRGSSFSPGGKCAAVQLTDDGNVEITGRDFRVPTELHTAVA
jgi:hypothetical protein